MSHRCTFSLGSNISPRIQYLRGGLRALAQAGLKIKKVSSLYYTSPVKFTRQPHFLNAVALAKTNLTPRDLLKLFKRIEQNWGRGAGKRYGPRTLDLDVLLYDNVKMKTKELSLPHPEMMKRKFVLVPLLEISPKLKGVSYERAILKLSSSQKIRLYRKSWIAIHA